jgi:hypothetical protein
MPAKNLIGPPYGASARAITAPRKPREVIPFPSARAAASSALRAEGQTRFAERASGPVFLQIAPIWRLQILPGSVLHLSSRENLRPLFQVSVLGCVFCDEFPWRELVVPLIHDWEWVRDHRREDADDDKAGGTYQSNSEIDFHEQHIFSALSSGAGSVSPSRKTRRGPLPVVARRVSLGWRDLHPQLAPTS